MKAAIMWVYVLPGLIWLLTYSIISRAYDRGTQRRKAERARVEADLVALLRTLGVFANYDLAELQRRRDAAWYEIEAARKELERARQELAGHLQNTR